MSRKHAHAPVTEYLHARFIASLGGHKLRAYSDGGPCDLNRQPKRATAKAQRKARRVQRLAA